MLRAILSTTQPGITCTLLVVFNLRLLWSQQSIVAVQCICMREAVPRGLSDDSGTHNAQ